MLDTYFRLTSVFLIVFSPVFFALETLFSQVIYFYFFICILIFFVLFNFEPFVKCLLMYRRLLFSLSLLITYILSRSYLADSLVSIDDYIHGVLLFFLYVFVFLILLYVLNDDFFVRVFIFSSVFFCFLSCVYSFVNYYFMGAYEIFPINYPWTFSWQDQIRGFFSYKNHFSSYLALHIIIVTYFLTVEFCLKFKI